MSTLDLRAERPADAIAIQRMVKAAFATLTAGERTEHRIVAALRDAGALSFSLLAESDGEVVGYAALSPVVIADDAQAWYGLGPVAVSPQRQRMGIGQQLIRALLHQAKDAGGHGCVVLGHPSYYRRFGFSRDHDLRLAEFDPAHFFALHWRGPRPSGAVRYHPAFATT